MAEVNAAGSPSRWQERRTLRFRCECGRSLSFDAEHYVDTEGLKYSSARYVRHCACGVANWLDANYRPRQFCGL